MPETTDPQPDRRDRYAQAIRETDGWVLDDGQHMIAAVMAVADAEQAELCRKLASSERIRENADFHLGQEMARRQLAEKETARLRAVVARLGQMSDHWEKQLPELIRTPAVVSAIRAALERAETVPSAPADRAAILREAADALVAVAGQHPEARAVVIHWGDAAALLRAMAQEECDELEAQAHLDQLADELPAPSRTADEAVTTRTFTRDELKAVGVPDIWTAADKGSAAEHLHEEQVDSRRWVSVHELIFRAPDDGKAYSVTYEQGLTENQDDTDPWNDEDEIKATEVEQRPVVIQQWLPVDPTA